MRPLPYPKEVYRHFKGNLYEIVTLAKNSETEEDMVVYKALYSPYITYVRELGMFLEEVDVEKYGAGLQKYRFEKVALEELSSEQKVNSEDTQEMKPEDNNTDVKPEEVCSKDKEAYALECLMEFLDARNFEDKLGVLLKTASFITDDMITTMAVSLDLEVCEGSTQERYLSLKKCLSTMQKYEGIRLRE